MLTKVLTALVPVPLIEKVDLIAARMERSRGWIVKQALSAWVDQEELRRRMTLDAMAPSVRLVVASKNLTLRCGGNNGITVFRSIY